MGKKKKTEGEESECENENNKKSELTRKRAAKTETSNPLAF